MAFYINKLYEKVIKSPGEFFDSLKVISGYASAAFLKRVINDFPKHNIILVIGMARKGISIQDHKTYKEICNKNSNIKIYYYVNSPPNHMKIYEWYKLDNPELAFIGSANFSESGFFKNHEILSPSLDVFTDLIDTYIKGSINCLDSEVEDLIPLYNQSSKDILELEEDLYIKADNNYKNNIKKQDDIIKIKSLILNNFKETPYNKTKVELLLKDDPHWDTRSLNNWNRGNRNKKDSYIDVERTKNMGIKKIDFFPRYAEVKIIADDEVRWIAKRHGEYGKELRVIKGMSFYDYFKERLGIDEERLISYDDFIKYGRSNVDFYKLNEKEYFLDFSI